MKRASLLLFLLLPIASHARNRSEIFIGAEASSASIETKRSDRTSTAKAEFNFVEVRPGLSYFLSDRVALRGGFSIGAGLSSNERISGFFFGGVWTPFSYISTTEKKSSDISITSKSSRSWFVGADFQQKNFSANEISLTFSGLRIESGFRFAVSDKETVSLSGFWDHLASGNERTFTGLGLSANYLWFFNL